MLTGKTPHLLTVAEYMTLQIDGRTELLGGIIYDVSPKNEPHSLAVRQLNKALTRGLEPHYVVSVQDPIAVSGWTGTNAPEIDVAVIADKSYAQTPTAADAFAFIEVSDSTYVADRRDRIPLYIEAGVPTWHVNVPARCVEFYARGASAEAPRVFAEHEALDILGVIVPVTDLFAAKPART